MAFVKRYSKLGANGCYGVSMLFRKMGKNDYDQGYAAGHDAGFQAGYVAGRISVRQEQEDTSTLRTLTGEMLHGFQTGHDVPNDDSEDDPPTTEIQTL